MDDANPNPNQSLELQTQSARQTLVSPSPSTLRWRLLRQAFLHRSENSSNHSSPSSAASEFQEEIKEISRKPFGSFNLIPHRMVGPCNENEEDSRHRLVSRNENVLIEYTLPFNESVNMLIMQRKENYVDIRDFQICKEYKIDNTGVVCLWPSEEVLAYYCLCKDEMFRDKRVLELGSGYGLAGLAIAACTEAAEVVISDGNPQVVDYIQKNIALNACCFGNTRVSPLLLHWGNDETFLQSTKVDFVIAADCTFFKEHHERLAETLKILFNLSTNCQAIFFCPRRGSTLDTFLQVLRNLKFHVQVIEHYDRKIWTLHENLILENNSDWPNYDYEHCYPLLINISM